MKAFSWRYVEQAVRYAHNGGQGLHLHRFIMSPNAPRCFTAAVNRGEPIAHLFDLNTERLVRTARQLGVKVIFIDKDETPQQHIDLCGRPLSLAIERCENASWKQFVRELATFARKT